MKYYSRMTLGDYLLRRAWRITAAAAVIAAVVWGLTEFAPGLERWRSAWPVLVMLVFWVRMGANTTARCPRCHARLYTVEPGPRSRRAGPTPPGFDSCTHCGLHVKDELRATDQVDTWP
jgi:hypothetical protein